MVFSQRLWHLVCRINSLPFMLDRWLFFLPKGWSLSFGFLVKCTVDNPECLPSTFSGKDFRYSPLDPEKKQIRLLKISPGNSEDVLKTTLITVDLLNAPSYEALSYVWGAYHERSSLMIDDCPVEIHAGLYNALHALRSRTAEKLVWADGTCIDQKNKLEQAHQIGIMGGIYETASTVAVHLGQPTRYTEEGLRILQFFLQTTDSLEDPPWSYTAVAEIEKGLADVLTRPWFTRIWTVQEATLARHTTFVCGEHRVSWSGDLHTLRAIVFRIKTAAISPDFWSHRSTLNWDPFLDILETQMRQAARREGVELRRNHLDLLYDFRLRRCTDPRDRYYGMFGIMESAQGGQLSLAPDYNLSLEQVHEQYTKEIRRVIDGEKDHKNLASPLGSSDFQRCR